MLRRSRIILGIIFFVLISMLFLDFTGTFHRFFGWMAKFQLIPAILALNFAAVAVLIIVTILFGRIYCSVICPLGVFQDAVSWTSGKFKKKNRFSYSPAISWLRYAVLVLFVIALIAGVSSIVVLLEPYSAYGRIASNLFAQVYRLGNNLLAYFAERIDSYAFYSVEVRIKSGVTFGIAVLTFLAVGYLAWRNGRTYCNTICPVGTVLGFISRFSIFKPVMDPDKCTKCSLCARNCKASCIDYKNYTIDYSRCVACMNCLGKCKFDALHYSAKRPEKMVNLEYEAEVKSSGASGMSRRGFLGVVSLFAASHVIKAQNKVDGGLAVIVDKKIPARETPVNPPGSGSARNMKQYCTGCQLCVSACPNNILRPSDKLGTFMQPEVSFERGYCRPECTRCSEVCPTGAIKRITVDEKSGLKIGRAVWIKENCVVNRDNVICTACERHCPTGAITLIPREPDNDKSLKIPVVDDELCIGCGACENLCPSRPFSAIYVEGITRQRII
ncbi:MAG: 4Fe-4S binding protein [Rikenellaceae bacterium]|nr:4Fe-4S binding protein [Rikenellaceae bacterium]